jgi:alpha,alpha-trehalase
MLQRHLPMDCYSEYEARRSGKCCTVLKQKEGTTVPPKTENGTRSSKWGIGTAAAYGFVLAAAVLLIMPWRLIVRARTNAVRVNVKETLKALMGQEDTDKDLKITVNDIHRSRSKDGKTQFWFTSVDGKRYEVTGLYYLANLLEELRLADEAGEEIAALDPEKIFERPTEHLSQMIREICWDGLTRRMDTAGLLAILADEKTNTEDGNQYVYVPESDPAAYEYYTKIAAAHASKHIRVVKLPAARTSEFSRSLETHHGILSLDIMKDPDGHLVPVPYLVPGGRFNEMYGWDSYFIALGLIADGKIELARSLADQLVYEIAHYGKILNANRTYYLTRSQPPFLTSMARAIYAAMPKNGQSKSWLRTVLDAAINEYVHVWTSPDHLTSIGLSRYFDTGTGPCPEVEPGAYDDVYKQCAARHQMTVGEFTQAYREGRVTDAELDDYFVHDRAMRESGHDTSYRLIGRAANLATIDLNSLLYKMENDIAELTRDEFGDAFPRMDGTTVRSDDYFARAEKRRELINRYLWDQDAGVFFDYDVVKHERTGYLSAASLYPMWAALASEAQAASLVHNALPRLAEPGGVAGSSEKSRGPLSSVRKERQWDYPNGWPPHQILIWRGLIQYGFDALAQRLAYGWLYSMTINAVQYNGTITEKLDVVMRTHDVFAEYGNVGMKFSYLTREGFGWSNASYQLGLALLTPALRADLDRLIPPEWIFE